MKGEEEKGRMEERKEGRQVKEDAEWERNSEGMKEREERVRYRANSKPL